MNRFSKGGLLSFFFTIIILESDLCTKRYRYNRQCAGGLVYYYRLIFWLHNSDFPPFRGPPDVYEHFLLCPWSNNPDLHPSSLVLDWRTRCSLGLCIRSCVLSVHC